MGDFIQNYAVATLKKWFELNSPLFHSYGTIAEYKESDRGSANVQIDTGKYLIDVCAWNHASCLDIQTIDIETEKSEFPHVGDCCSKQEFEQHLQDLIRWYKLNHG
jgi:hypothetical protein